MKDALHQLGITDTIAGAIAVYADCCDPSPSREASGDIFLHFDAAQQAQLFHDDEQPQQQQQMPGVFMQTQPRSFALVQDVFLALAMSMVRSAVDATVRWGTPTHHRLFP